MELLPSTVRTKTAPTTPKAADGRKPAILLGLIVLLWAVLRWRFFFGFLGYDDLWYTVYASKWGAIPQNHWEVRVLFTGLIRLCTGLLGPSEFSATAPALLSSLAMLFVTFRLGWKYAGVTGACLGGLLFSLLPQDLFSSTSVDAVALTSALSCLGFLFLLERPGYRGIIPAGILLGLAVFSHAYALFVLAAAAFAWLIHAAPDWKWKESAVLFGTGAAVFLAVNSLVFHFMTGNAFFPFKVSAQSHLQTFGKIVYDLGWLIWPLKAFLFTNEFGFLLALAAGSLALAWRRAGTGLRFLGFFSVVFYAYTNWGSQSPTQYLPLWHLPRYWYPIAVPACVVAGCCLASFPRRAAWGAVSAVGGIQVLLLLMAGSWGENVEVSKALLRHAESHPDQRFVTDGLTLNEMFVLKGCVPPANVFPVRGMGQPGYFSVPEESQVDAAARPLLLLANRSQAGRNGVAPYLQLAGTGRWEDLGPARFRGLSAFLPATLGQKPFMLRHPPPAVVALP